MSGASVFIHRSQFPARVRAKLHASLQRREVNHQFHYATHKQARQWLALHEAHSPARTDRNVRSVYDRSFAAVSAGPGASDVCVIGLGCGGGHKDARLLELLPARRRISYTACDVSVPLVLAARERAMRVIPPERIRCVACDLGELDAGNDLFPRSRGGTRLFTFFGMIPNFEPRPILRRLASLLGPGDRLLFSANLVPGPDHAHSMRRILPQYDNALTREWLMTFLLDLGVERRDGTPRFEVETVPGRPALRRFVARFHFQRTREVWADGREIRFCRGESVRLFFSYRHTPESIAALLRARGISVLDRWLSGSGEEGVFLCGRTG
jgi:uncharacterized SAM-dependent methyltransferase